jgi:hypothetical protein
MDEQQINESGDIFQHRVRVLVDVVDDVDEKALVASLCARRGWPTRSAHAHEARGSLPKDRTWLVIEVRLPGHGGTAPRAAVRRVSDLAATAELSIRIRYAEVINYQSEYQKQFYIEDVPPAWVPKSTLLRRALKLAGIPRMTGLIRVPWSVSDDQILAEVSRYDLGKPFDPTRETLRPAAHYSKTVPERSANGIAIDAFSVVALVLSVLWGMCIEWVPAGWKVLPVLAVLAMAFPIGRVWARFRVFPQWLYISLVLAISLAAGGFMFALDAPRSVSRPLPLLVATGAIAVACLAWQGAQFALRESRLTREISWLLPLIVTSMVPVILALGGVFDMEYLSVGFGIPADTVGVPEVLRLAIAMKSLFIAVIFVFLIVSIVGWMRYFHGIDRFTRAPIILMFLGVSLLYVLASVGAGLSVVDGAAYAAAAQARAGRQPAAYFGLQGTLMCIHQVNSPTPVYNGPLPVRKPVVSFGTTTTELWVWDPGSGRAIGIPLQDVQTTPATGSPAHC